ncbi:MAG: UDP-glucose 4-epimerase [Solirubrobacterales bacterium]|nr:UDP-glucose 4-epimerase [Solirubrobacterales bacterium]
MATIAITGGTGFLGRNLGLALRDEHDVVLAGRNNKQNFQAQAITGCRVMPLDVSNVESVRDMVIDVKPDVIIHAAATKFVDLAERQPMECVDVNVLGSQNVARVAVERGVSTVIGVSTDKAAPPVRNTYGLSKSLMERVYCSMDAKSDSRFTCVRYGNVAWSTGSVLPIWREMARTTGMIGTTGPHMRRFFFTVDEAVALVLAAMDEIDTVRGKVLSRYMKAAQIADLLEVCAQEWSCRWEPIEGRPGERDDEFLIGDIELPYTRELTIGDVPHYLISFNEKVEPPLAEGLSSANTARLSQEEMTHLVTSPAE